MIHTDYVITCDKCNSSLGPVAVCHSFELIGETSISKFWKVLAKDGWRRIDAKDHCPDCVQAVSAEYPPAPGEVRKPRQIKKLSKTAQDAFLSRRIDEEQT